MIDPPVRSRLSKATKEFRLDAPHGPVPSLPSPRTLGGRARMSRSKRIFRIVGRLLFGRPVRWYSDEQWVHGRNRDQSGWGTEMSSATLEKGARSGSVTRRDFLRVGGLSVMGLSVAERAAFARAHDATAWRSCIFLMMTGGASHLDTFDPKPDAPSEFRGPMRAIRTSIPGVQLSESLPKLAKRMDRFSLLRSLGHDAAPIHETGQQLIQTGRLASNGERPPSFGSVVSQALGGRSDAPAYVVLPRLLGDTGVSTWQGQGAGILGDDFDPAVVRRDGTFASPTLPLDGQSSAGSHRLGDEPEPVRRAYGDSRMGELCLRARQLVESGVRCVTVNLFDALTGHVTWDCHGRAPWSPATLFDYRDTLCPQFDRAVSALLDDLSDRGLLDDTLVVATGEFGRTPRVNDFAGRDHWPAVWSALIAGGGVSGGQVIGASDHRGCFPVDRPVHPAELTGTIYHSLGLIDPPGREPEPVEAAGHPSIVELFA